MARHRRGGTIGLSRNGSILEAKGNFTVNLGYATKEEIIGADGVHGFKETHKAAFVEGEITDRGDLSIADLVNAEDEDITIRLATDKAIVLREAWYAGDGNLQTEEGNIQVKFCSKFPAEEIAVD